MVIATTPACSKISTTSGKLMLFAFHPKRILAVTGLDEYETICETYSFSFCGFFNQAEPAPVFVTLGTGQPKFKSRKSYEIPDFCIISMAFCVFSILLPNSCIPTG